MENNWIEWKWTPEKPYPETLETEVYVKYNDGAVGLCRVLNLHNDNYEMSNWFDHNDDDTVIAYKVVK